MGVIYFNGSGLIVVCQDGPVGCHREHHSAGVYVVNDLLGDRRSKKCFRICRNCHLISQIKSKLFFK